MPNALSRDMVGVGPPYIRMVVNIGGRPGPATSSTAGWVVDRTRIAIVHPGMVATMALARRRRVSVSRANYGLIV